MIFLCAIKCPDNDLKKKYLKEFIKTKFVVRFCGEISKIFNKKGLEIAQ
jgi:hypothetical protein